MDKLLEQADAILDSTLEVKIKNGKTTEKSFPNSSSLAAKPDVVIFKAKIINNKIPLAIEQIP